MNSFWSNISQWPVPFASISRSIFLQMVEANKISDIFCKVSVAYFSSISGKADTLGMTVSKFEYSFYLCEAQTWGTGHEVSCIKQQYDCVGKLLNFSFVENYIVETWVLCVITKTVPLKGQLSLADWFLVKHNSNRQTLCRYKTLDIFGKSANFLPLILFWNMSSWS